MPIIYSTLANSQHYVDWSAPGAEKPSVLIRGGSDMPRGNILTLTSAPAVETEITEAQLEILQRIPAFLDHVKEKCLEVRKSKVDLEKAADGMKRDDKSKPITPDEVKKGSRRVEPKPTIDAEP